MSYDLYDMEYLAETLALHASGIKELKDKVAAVMESPTARKIHDLETKVEDLQLELSQKTVQLRDLRERHDSSVAKVRAIRRSTNGSGANPLTAHVEAVYEALKEAAPSHYLVTRDIHEKYNP